MFDPIATHECDDGREIAVGESDGRCAFELVLNGPGAREVSIPFETVAVESNTTVLYCDRYEPKETGSIEGKPEVFGAVGEWLGGLAATGAGIDA